MGSPHKYEANALMKRAKALLELASEVLKKENDEVSCFLSEQAGQLHLKAVLLKEIGDYSRIHSIRALLAEVAKGSGRAKVSEFIRRNRVRILALEDS